MEENKMQPQDPQAPQQQPYQPPQPQVPPTPQNGYFSQQHPQPTQPQYNAPPTPASQGDSYKNPKNWGWGYILSFIPILGLILSIRDMKNPNIQGYIDKRLNRSALMTSIVTTAFFAIGVVVVIIMTISFFVASNHTKNTDSANTGSSLQADADSQKTSETSDSTFGLKVGQDRSSVEQSLGQPESSSEYVKPCTTYPNNTATALGYDTTCSYKVGEATKSSAGKTTIPMTTVRYLNNKLVEASKVSSDGTITSLTKDGVTTFKP